MISHDIRIQGFDAHAFTNLVSLFAPNVVWRNERDPQDSDAPELDERATEAQRAADGTLVVVVSPKGTVRKAFHTVRGRVRDFRFEGWDRLEGVAARYGARRVIVLREGVLEDLVARASQRMHREDDYVTQWLHVARAIREELDAGRVAVHPRPFVSVPLPTPQLVRRAMDSVLPDDRTFVLSVWRGPTLWTSAVLRRRGGEIDWVAGPDLLLAWTGPLGGDWRRDHRIVSQAVAAHVAPVHLGIYGELRSIRKLLRSREPGAWARAVAARDIIVSPTPPYVAVALGADAMRRVARKSTELLGGLDPLKQLGPLLGLLRGRVAEVASVTQTLGFDPLKLLAQFLQRVDPLERAGEDDAQERGLDLGSEPRAPSLDDEDQDAHGRDAFGDAGGNHGLGRVDALGEAANDAPAHEDGWRADAAGRGRTTHVEGPTDAPAPDVEHDEDGAERP